MAKKLKPVELFLSLGLVASLATACGGPTEDADVIEEDGVGIEEPVEEEDLPEEDEMEEMEEDGGEGGEGGEG
ncbi:MAG: hypothetical protein WBD47_18535 [Phormidesmis sp.]